jgi:selenide,water dikinase
VGAVLSLPSVPLLEGARQCVEAGVLSTLHPQNIRCSQAISNLEMGATSSVYPLLFDPQTAGGLIGTVKREAADALLQALREAGYPASAIVGRVTTRTDTADGAPFITLEM